MSSEMQASYQEEELQELASGVHGEIATTISGYLFMHLLQNDLGRLFDSSTTFLIAPNLPKREPDVAFVALERLPENVDDVVPVAPDLAVEIISGSDGWKEVVNKATTYLHTGVKVVWVVDPYTKAVFEFTPEHAEAFKTLRGEDELSCENVIPGFKLKVRQVFEKARRVRA